MFKKEELVAKKKFEVQGIAKELGIPRYKGKSERTKDELISDILNTEVNSQPDEEWEEDEELTKELCTEENVEVPNEKVEQVQPEVKESKVVSEVKKLNEKKVLTEEERAAKKRRYIEDAQVGTLVAFRTDTGRVKSAMIKKRSTSKRRFLLETNYGAKYKVSFDDILWVRTNKRWPKGIFQLLRGEKVETTKGE